MQQRIHRLTRISQRPPAAGAEKRAEICGLSAAAAAVLILAAGAAGAVPLQPQELPPAQEVIARYVEAIGGAEAIRGHSSTHGRGTMELLGQGIRGEVQIYAAAPDKSLLVVSFADMGIEIRTGYNGEVAWSTDPMTGERILQSDERQQIVDESDYYADLHDPAGFQSMETVEMTEFAGRSTYKVKLVYNSGRQSFEYFDVESGRLVGEEGLQHSFMGAINVRAFASDYQRFGDIMVPTKIVQELGTMIWCLPDSTVALCRPAACPTPSLESARTPE